MGKTASGDDLGAEVLGERVGWSVGETVLEREDETDKTKYMTHEKKVGVYVEC